MMKKTLEFVLDFLMFIVPMMELTELVAVIPVEYLPWYMLATVILRRGLRLLEEKVNAKPTDRSL